MTFGEMRTVVASLINQPLEDDNRTVTKTFVDTVLNLGYKKVVNRVNALNEDYYLRESYANVVADQDSYTLPDDAKILVRLDISYSGEYIPVTLTSPQVVIDTDSVAASNPIAFLIGDGFKIMPSPDEDITNGFRLFYIENVADMSDDADEPNLPLGYEDLPIYYAAGMAHKLLQNETLAKEFLDEFAAEVNTMTQERLRRRQDDNDSVIIREDPIE